MFCSYCGQQIPDGSKFCPKCGHRLDVSDESDNSSSSASGHGTDSSNQSYQKMRPGSSSTIQKKNSFNIKKLLPILIVCVLAVVIIIVVAVNHKPTVDLSKYIEITFDGYDTVGSASYSFDSDQFQNDYNGKLKINQRALQKAINDVGSDTQKLMDLFGDSVSDYLNSIDPATFISYGLDGTLDPSENLSNGDTVTFSWDLTDDDLKEMGECFNCKFRADDVTANVEGLKEPEIFDPFDGVKITYSGMEPDGWIYEISDGNDPACQYLGYSADKSDGLSNGDTITVTVDSYSSDNLKDFLITNYGKIPSETSKEYTVSGLSHYIRSASEIPETTMKQMQEQAEDAFNTNIVAYWDSGSQELANLQYIGNYFLTATNTGISGQNIIYLVYKVTAHVWYQNDSGESYDDNFDYYWYCSFNDLTITDKNECSVNLMDYDMPGDFFYFDSHISNGWWGTKDWDFYGYETLDELYSQIELFKSVSYKIDNNVEDSAEEETADSKDVSNSSVEIPSAYQSIIDNAKSSGGSEGYILRDMNGDGAEDLMIGSSASGEVSGNPIFKLDDVYTLNGSEAIHIYGRGGSSVFYMYPETDGSFVFCYYEPDGSFDSLFTIIDLSTSDYFIYKDGYHSGSMTGTAQYTDDNIRNQSEPSDITEINEEDYVKDITDKMEKNALTDGIVCF